jgi:hypothetical protein
MHPPYRGQRPRQRPPLEYQQAHQVYEQDIEKVQSQVHRVISRRVRAVAKYGVIHQVGERSERPVKPSGRGIVPILLVQNEMEIQRRRRMNAGIPEDRLGAVEDHAALERVGIRDHGDRQQRQDLPAVPGPETFVADYGRGFWL